MKKKIYISGQISNLKFEDAEWLFDQTEIYLTNIGYDVVNPIRIEHNHDLSWINYMKTDIKALMDCDSIYML